MDSPSDRPRLLLVIGADEEAVRIDRRVKLSGLTDLPRLLGEGAPSHRLRVTPDFLERRPRPDLSPYRTVMNLITEPELNPAVLAVLADLLGDFAGQVVNPPEAVLRSTRDQVALTLAGVPGAQVPKVVRLRGGNSAAGAVEAAGLRFPALLREAGAHTGRFVGRFDTIDALQSALPDEGEYLLTEFVDFRSGDGLYRKYRIFFIGERRIVRHMLVSDDWNVHAQDRMRFMAGRPELLAEERNLLAVPEGAFPPSVHDALGHVRSRMTLDFFGVDFAILPDGRLLLFEANATMNFFPFLSDPAFAYLLQAIGPAQAALRALAGLPPVTPAIVMGDLSSSLGAGRGGGPFTAE